MKIGLLAILCAAFLISLSLEAKEIMEPRESVALSLIQETLPQNQPNYSYTTLQFLLQEQARTHDPDLLRSITILLDEIARGTTRDHLGGGFYQDSGNAAKLLSDNARLLRAYAMAYSATGNIFYRKVAEETASFVLREMRDVNGFFWTAIGVPCPTCPAGIINGNFYLWSQEEIIKMFGEARAREFSKTYPLQPSGFLSLQGSPFAGLSYLKETLLIRRNRRVKPAPDKNIDVALNGLMIGALAKSGALLHRGADIQAARKTAEAILPSFLDRLSKNKVSLNDSASLAEGLLALFDATGDQRLLTPIKTITDYLARPEAFLKTQ